MPKIIAKQSKEIREEADKLQREAHLYKMERVHLGNEHYTIALRREGHAVHRFSRDKLS